jgi:hypothetical protein
MRMVRLGYLAAAAATFGLCLWLGLGWEETSIDHEARYVAFVKSYPSTKVVFRSYLGCDECDATSYLALDREQQAEFASFCNARFGFDDPRVCDAIYREQRKIRLEKITAQQAERP